MNDVYKEELENYLNRLYEELGMLQNEMYDFKDEIERIEEELRSIK